MTIIIAAGVLIYGCRLAGFAVSLDDKLSKYDPFLQFIPICVLTSLITSSLLKEPELAGYKYLALLVTGVLVWKTNRVGLAILAGFGLFWLSIYN